MKKLLTILCLVLLSVHSYSQEVIPEVETVTRDGLIYHQLSTEPLTGTVVSFYDNGRLLNRKNYRNGKREGLWETFHENGQLWMRRNFIDGERDGLSEMYHDNGQLWERGNYIDGKKDGLWETFNDDEKLIWTRTFRNGELVKTNRNP